MRIRTADPLLAKQMLYQLSYTPAFTCADSEEAKTKLYAKSRIALHGNTEIFEICGSAFALHQCLGLSSSQSLGIDLSALWS